MYDLKLTYLAVACFASVRVKRGSCGAGRLRHVVFVIVVVVVVPGSDSPSSDGTSGVALDEEAQDGTNVIDRPV